MTNQGGGGAAVAQIPTSFGHELRACLRCRLVKTYDQFRESGCENCPFFQMEDDHERVVDCTTPNFTGLISVMDPARSWAARWLRIENIYGTAYMTKDFLFETIGVIYKLMAIQWLSTIYLQFAECNPNNENLLLAAIRSQSLKHCLMTCRIYVKKCRCLTFHPNASNWLSGL